MKIEYEIRTKYFDTRTSQNTDWQSRAIYEDIKEAMCEFEYIGTYRFNSYTAQELSMRHYFTESENEFERIVMITETY
jgi:hypothetical protein